ncbi:MAG: hypothetical protein ACTSYG_06790 [Candidatus Heimdallarchaeota archaeon]
MTKVRWQESCIIALIILGTVLSGVLGKTRKEVAVGFESEEQKNSEIKHSLPLNRGEFTERVNYSLIERWDERQANKASEIEISGNIAFIVDDYKSIGIYNISQKEKTDMIYDLEFPEECSIKEIQAHNELLFVQISHKELYYTRSEVIEIYNISNLAKPEMVGMIVRYYFSGFYVNGNLLFLLLDSPSWGISIYNIVDPAKPKLVVEITTESYFYISSITLDEGYLYVAFISHEFVVYDIRTVSKPFLLFQVVAPFQSEINNIQKVNDRLYLLGTEHLAIFSAKNREKPKLIASYDMVEMLPDTRLMVKQFFTWENSLIVFSRPYFHSYIQTFILDVSDPLNLKVINEMDPLVVHIRKFNFAAALEASTLFLTVGGSILQIYTLSDPENFLPIAGITEPKMTKFDFKGEIVVVCDSYNGLKLFNFSQPEELILLSKLKNGKSFQDVVINDRIIFAVDGENLTIINATEPQKLALLSTIKVEGAFQLVLDEHFIYIAGKEKFYVVNITAQDNPQVISVLELTGFSISDIAVKNDFAIATEKTGKGCVIINTTRKDNVSILSALKDFAGQWYSVELYQDQMMIAANSYGVLVYNISNLVAPTLTQQIALSDTGRALKDAIYNSSLLLIATDQEKVLVYNLSETTIQKPLKELCLPSRAFQSENELNFDFEFITERLFVTSSLGFSIYGLDNDKDSLADYLEECLYGTSTLENDTDSDSLPDYYEILYNLQPNNSSDALLDADLDGFTNLAEFLNGTNPIKQDTDHNGAQDGAEYFFYFTDPLDGDSDKDGILDGFELFTLNSSPLSIDTDHDELSDWFELYIYMTLLNDSDTDDDLIQDGYEAFNYLNPKDSSDSAQDLDLDGLTNYEEFLLGTKAFRSDSDFDGYSDFEEVLEGTNPLDQEDFPDYKKTPAELQTDKTSYIGPAIIMIVITCVAIINQLKRRKKNEE